MRSKLGRTRPVSESELSFLSTFHLRFRKAIEALRSDKPSPPAAKVAVAKPEPAPREDPRPHSGEPDAAPVRDEEPAAADGGSGEDPAEDRPEDAELPAEAAESPPPSRPPSRGASSAGGTSTAPHRAAENDAAPHDEPAVTEPSDEPEPGPVRLTSALADHDTKAVLRELYREVTGIADGIWSSDILPAPIVWDEVCTSDWYEKSFSPLGLKPLSDFYEIISSVEEKTSEGGDRKEIHTYLKQMNFAQVLLALRDMFQRNGL